jgi:hypothetical protein
VGWATLSSLTLGEGHAVAGPSERPVWEGTEATWQQLA